MDLVTYLLGGANSGGGLPPVTAADNGKVLGVESGAWGARDWKGVFWIHAKQVSGQMQPPDKTYAEILAAYDAGLLPILLYENNNEFITYPFNRKSTSGGLWFSGIDRNGTNATISHIYFTTTGDVYRASGVVAYGLPAYTSADAGKIPTVNSSGNIEWVSIPSANGQSF